MKWLQRIQTNTRTSKVKHCAWRKVLVCSMKEYNGKNQCSRSDRLSMQSRLCHLTRCKNLEIWLIFLGYSSFISKMKILITPLVIILKINDNVYIVSVSQIAWHIKCVKSRVASIIIAIIISIKTLPSIFIVDVENLTPKKKTSVCYLCSCSVLIFFKAQIIFIRHVPL